MAGTEYFGATTQPHATTYDALRETFLKVTNNEM